MHAGAVYKTVGTVRKGFMQSELYDILKVAIGDKTYKVDGEDTSVLEIVCDWEDHLTKIKTPYEEVKSERSKLKEERTDLRNQITTLETELNELKEQLDTNSKDKKKKESMSDELQRQLNALTDKLKTVEESFESEKQKNIDAENRVKEATKVSALEKLKSSVVTQLEKHDIVGARAELAWNTIQSNGNASIREDENGSYVESFTDYKDGKELASNLADMCDNFAQEHKFLVSSSNRNGTGDNHQNSSRQSVNDGNYMRMISQR